MLTGQMNTMAYQRTSEPRPGSDSVEAAWRTHGPSALRFAAALVGPSDAHDITTTAFLRVTRQPRWSDIEHLDRYLLRAVKNEATNLYRQRKRQWERDIAAVRPEPSVDSAPDVDLIRHVAALSVRQRSVVFLTYWCDMTESDIAATLEISRSSVHRTLTRARNALRKSLR